MHPSTKWSDIHMNRFLFLPGLNHCSSDPCLHGGECTTEYGGYSCDCPEPWYGDICENKEINRTGVRIQQIIFLTESYKRIYTEFKHQNFE